MRRVKGVQGLPGRMFLAEKATHAKAFWPQHGPLKKLTVLGAGREVPGEVRMLNRGTTSCHLLAHLEYFYAREQREMPSVKGQWCD